MRSLPTVKAARCVDANVLDSVGEHRESRVIVVGEFHANVL